MQEKTPKKIRIAGRVSELSVRQTELVAAYIRSTHPEWTVEMVTMKTTGDRILHRTLDEIGGKGLFVKELDEAVLQGRADLAVHSLKDMPETLPEGLQMVAFSPREDPRDVLVLPEGEKRLDLTKPVGCSSRRRAIQFQRLCPKAKIQGIRGNVPTRLEKLDAGDYGALILAAAGLKRLGLDGRISRYFSVEEILPCAGQGILCVEGRKNVDYAYLKGYEDADARDVALAERAFTAALGGGCSAPVAAYATVQGDRLRLRGWYMEEASGRIIGGELSGSREQAVALGGRLAKRLKGE